MIFDIRGSTRLELRNFFLRGIAEFREIGGVFDSAPFGSAFELKIAQTFFGNRGRVDIPPAEITFHTHPLLFDKMMEKPQNAPNLISSADLVSVLLNDARLRQRTGRFADSFGIFDILLSPMGIFVYGAGSVVIEKWNRFGRKGASSSAIATYVLGKGKWQKIAQTYEVFGYSSCREDSKAATRAWSSFSGQRDWFSSDEFMALDMRSAEMMLPAYLKEVEEIGYNVLFFNWGPLEEDLVFEWFPK